MNAPKLFEPERAPAFPPRFEHSNGGAPVPSAACGLYAVTPMSLHGRAVHYLCGLRVISVILSQIEDARRLLVLYGNKVSQLVKDVLVDLHRTKKVLVLLRHSLS
jgi:hypothetical protein